MNNTIYSIGNLDPNMASAPSFKEICELNQVTMLQQLEKIPIGIFIFITLAMLTLAFHIYVLPRLNEKMRGVLSNNLLTFSLMSLVWAFLFSLAVTFNLSPGFWLWSERIVTLMLVAFGLIVCYNIIKEIRKGNIK